MADVASRLMRSDRSTRHLIGGKIMALASLVILVAVSGCVAGKWIIRVHNRRVTEDRLSAMLVSDSWHRFVRGIASK
jgi:hypothetical protein